METRQNQRLESLHQAQAFIDEHASRLGEMTSNGMRRRLDEVIIELDALATGQGGNALKAMGTTRRHRALRTILVRDHMSHVAGIAQVELPRTPEVEPLRLPAGNITAANLALAAQAMAHAATPFRDVFIVAGMPHDFIERLTSASDAMMESLRHRSQTLGKRVGATAGVAASLAAGRRIVRALDRFVVSEIHDDPALLAHWKSVVRVRRTTHHASDVSLGTGVGEEGAASTAYISLTPGGDESSARTATPGRVAA